MKKNRGVPYCISFETKEMPGKIVAVSVALDKVIMRDIDTARVDLVDHPLYEKLEQYVLANPSAKRLAQAKK